MGRVAIATDVAVEEYAARVGSLNTKAMSLRVPYLDTAATIDPDTRMLTCAIVNRAADQAIDAEVTVTGGGIDGEVEVWTLTGESLEAENTVDDPPARDAHPDGRGWQHPQPCQLWRPQHDHRAWSDALTRVAALTTMAVDMEGNAARGLGDERLDDERLDQLTGEALRGA